MPGARCTRGLVCRMRKQKKAHTSIQGSGEQSDIPCAMALRRTSCSSRWGGLVVTVARGKRASRELDASIRGVRTTRLGRTLSFIRPPNKRVHHSLGPTVRDDREAPLVWAEDARSHASDLPDVTRRIFSISALDTISYNQK